MDQNFSIPAVPYRAVIFDYGNTLGDQLTGWRMTEHAILAIHKLRKEPQIRLAVLSNSDGRDNRQGLRDLLNRDAMLQYFDAVLSLNGKEEMKPQLTAFWRMCHFLMIPPQRCLMVGDKPEAY